MTEADFMRLAVAKTRAGIAVRAGNEGPRARAARAVVLPVHDEPAVHVDRLPGHVPGPRGRQEHGHRGHVVRLLPAAQGYDPADLLAGPFLVTLPPALRLPARPGL